MLARNDGDGLVRTKRLGHSAVTQIEFVAVRCRDVVRTADALLDER